MRATLLLTGLSCLVDILYIGKYQMYTLVRVVTTGPSYPIIVDPVTEKLVPILILQRWLFLTLHVFLGG